MLKGARKVLQIAKGAKKLPSNLSQLVAEATRKKVDTRRRNR